MSFFSVFNLTTRFLKYFTLKGLLLEVLRENGIKCVYVASTEPGSAVSAFEASSAKKKLV